MSYSSFVDALDEWLVNGLESGSLSQAVIDQRWTRPFPEEDTYCVFTRVQKNKAIKNQDLLLNQWIVGGSDGGSVYNSSKSERYTVENARREFMLLRGIIEQFAPDLKFLDWLKIEKDLIHQESWTKTEYYCNNTDWRYEWIGLEDLYDFLVEKQILKCEEITNGL